MQSKDRANVKNKIAFPEHFRHDILHMNTKIFTYDIDILEEK